MSHGVGSVVSRNKRATAVASGSRAAAQPEESEKAVSSMDALHSLWVVTGSHPAFFSITEAARSTASRFPDGPSTHISIVSGWAMLLLYYIIFRDVSKVH